MKTEHYFLAIVTAAETEHQDLMMIIVGRGRG
jgi:hypothetical protein